MGLSGACDLDTPCQSKQLLYSLTTLNVQQHPINTVLAVYQILHERSVGSSHYCVIIPNLWHPPYCLLQQTYVHDGANVSCTSILIRHDQRPTKFTNCEWTIILPGLYFSTFKVYLVVWGHHKVPPGYRSITVGQSRV